MAGPAKADLLRGLLAHPPPESEDQTYLVGDGPAECSSSTALSVLPAVIWDVNGYYHELGVHPRATRGDLRKAYQAKDGQDSARLTYILWQLLQPEVRFEYDCTPLGEVFLDTYVRQRIHNEIKSRMSQRLADLDQQGVDMTFLDHDAIERDIAAEMGFMDASESDDDTPDQTVDDDPPAGEDDPDRPAKFKYSYYLWGTRSQQDLQSLGRLAEWQRLLVGALSRRGVSVKFAVGLHGRWQSWLHGIVGYREVYFLRTGEVPTIELAEAAVGQVLIDRQRAHQQQQHTLANTERDILL